MSALSRDIAALTVDADKHEVIALHAIDTLAALSGGLQTSEGRAIAEVLGGSDPASRIAAMAAVIRFTECDDIHVPTCMTAGAIVMPIAGELARDADSFARAVAAGYGIGLALARAVGGVEALSKGVWPALFAAPAVAATTAAVALGFGEPEIAAAIGLAIAGSSGRGGRPGGRPSGRWIMFGEAVRKGVGAAFAVRHGAAGDPGLLSPDWLAAQAPSGLAAPEHLNALPDDAVTRFDLKPYVAARQGQNAIQAFQAVLARGLTADAIRTVEVSLPPEALGVVTRPLDPGERLSTIAHLGLQLATAAHEPHRLYDLARERPFAPATLAFADKVIVRADESLAGAKGWPARVRVETSSGAFEEESTVLAGDPRASGREAMLAGKLAGLNAPSSVTELLTRKRQGWPAFVDAQIAAQAAIGAAIATAPVRAARNEDTRLSQTA